MGWGGEWEGWPVEGRGLGLRGAPGCGVGRDKEDSRMQCRCEIGGGESRGGVGWGRGGVS